MIHTDYSKLGQWVDVLTCMELRRLELGFESLGFFYIKTDWDQTGWRLQMESIYGQTNYEANNLPELMQIMEQALVKFEAYGLTLYSAHGNVYGDAYDRPTETKVDNGISPELLLEAAREHVYDHPGLQLPAQVELFGRLVKIDSDRWTGRLRVEE